MDSPAFWPLALGGFGLIFGSFIATVALRWPEGRSALTGRSECDACGKALAPHELVPVLSYVVLRGRCAGCGSAIRPSHLAIELLGLGIGVAAGMAAPGQEGVAGAGFGWMLLLLGALDLTALWLPNPLTAALAVSGLGIGLLGIGPPIESRVIGGLAGFAALWLAAAGYKALRGRIGLGGGDPKLFGAIGLWLGWEMLPLVLLAACLIGLSAVLGLRMGGRKVSGTDRLPLGAMLAVAAWAAWLGLAVTPPQLVTYNGTYTIVEVPSPKE
jgi:leader peptidase (prepilin peptidase)/N-methyltransferase